jgi:regulatory protein
MPDFKFLYKKSLDYLSRREHSSKEILAKLMQHTADNDLISSVIDRLVEQKYLSDSRYVEVYINSKKSRYGLQRIKYTLNDKVDNASDMIAELGLEISNEEQLATAVDLLTRKYRYVEYDLIDYNKCIRFLCYRGFNLSIAKDAFKEFKSQIKNDEM